MTLFLTSSFCDREAVRIDPAAGFLEELKKRLKGRLKALFICSHPHSYELSDFYGLSTRACFEAEGFSFEAFTILDDRNDYEAPGLIGSADLIILSGGHVPTQNRYFRQLGLKKLLSGFDGVLIGISAGTMNCADTVYAQPEEEGEAADPHFKRYLKGLGFTDINVLPHYNEIRELTLDGLRIMEDIAFPDSFIRPILVLPDGSYVLCENGKESIRGEAWWLRDGVMTPV